MIWQITKSLGMWGRFFKFSHTVIYSLMWLGSETPRVTRNLQRQFFKLEKKELWEYLKITLSVIFFPDGTSIRDGCFLKLWVQFFYYKLKRINQVTETNRKKLDYHYMSPGQHEGIDHYQKISQPSLKSVIWTIKHEIETRSQKKHNIKTATPRVN